jgi:hypothetical protein
MRGNHLATLIELRTVQQIVRGGTVNDVRGNVALGVIREFIVDISGRSPMRQPAGQIVREAVNVAARIQIFLIVVRSSINPLPRYSPIRRRLPPARERLENKGVLNYGFGIGCARDSS